MHSVDESANRSSVATCAYEVSCRLWRECKMKTIFWVRNLARLIFHLVLTFMLPYLRRCDIFTLNDLPSNMDKSRSCPEQTGPSSMMRYRRTIEGLTRKISIGTVGFRTITMNYR